MAPGKDDDHHHGHDHEHGSELSETQLRVRALESILTEKGYVDSATLDAMKYHIGRGLRRIKRAARP